MQNYPIYRKFLNRKEFRKINNDKESIAIQVNKNYTTIIHSQNALRVADALDESISTESTHEEWEKVYDETLCNLSKANQAQ
jgi:hypothetical protein